MFLYIHKISKRKLSILTILVVPALTDPRFFCYFVIPFPIDSALTPFAFRVPHDHYVFAVAFPSRRVMPEYRRKSLDKKKSSTLTRRL